MRRRRRRAQGGKDRGAGKPGWERSPYEVWPAEVDSSVWRAWSGSIMRAGSRSRGLDATRGRPLDMSVRTGSQPYIGSRSWSLAGMSERMQHRSTRFQGVLPAFASQPCEDAASENGGVVTAALGSREFCASQPLPRRVPWHIRSRGAMATPSQEDPGDMRALSEEQGANHIPIHVKFNIDFQTFGKDLQEHPKILAAEQDPEPPSTTAPAARCQHDHKMVVVMLVASTQGCGGGAACPEVQNEPRQKHRDLVSGPGMETLEQLLVVRDGERL